MKKLRVIYDGWGEHWSLGTLADTAQGVLFEYSQQAIECGILRSFKFLVIAAFKLDAYRKIIAALAILPA